MGILNSHDEDGPCDCSHADNDPNDISNMVILNLVFLITMMMVAQLTNGGRQLLPSSVGRYEEPGHWMRKESQNWKGLKLLSLFVNYP